MSVLSGISVRIDVPKDAFVEDEPLAAILRGGLVSGVHRGVLTVSDVAGREVLSVGDRKQPVFMRSAAKPFQVMPAILSGGIDRFHLTEQEVAVLCASHHAEPRHVEAVLSVLHKIGLDESFLQCGIHTPISSEATRTLWRNGLDPSAVHNNCSGAHTGMLVACRANHWTIEEYGNENHPLQRQTLAILATFADMDAHEVRWGIDNCGVPAFQLPLAKEAQAFARLATGHGVTADLRLAAERVVRAMTGYPEMVGGEHSFDTAVLRQAGGKIVLKGGADGFEGVGARRDGLGLAVKITDESSRPIPAIVLPILRALGILDDDDLASLESCVATDVCSHEGELIGRLMSLVSAEISR